MTNPTKKDALEAVKTLLKWIGEDPERPGLIDTPKRVLNAYSEFFSGYKEDPIKILSRSFENEDNYSGMVLVKDIEFDSHCEHHMVPIKGVAHIAYFPVGRIVGISKLARLIDVFALRLQTQENMTEQVAKAMIKALNPLGLAIYIDASHMCMTTRGAKKRSSSTVTSHYSGLFQEESNKMSFLESIKNN
jgi:GTP cyclohydrolase I